MEEVVLVILGIFFTFFVFCVVNEMLDCKNDGPASELKLKWTVELQLLNAMNFVYIQESGTP